MTSPPLLRIPLLVGSSLAPLHRGLSCVAPATSPLSSLRPSFNPHLYPLLFSATLDVAPFRVVLLEFAALDRHPSFHRLPYRAPPYPLHQVDAGCGPLLSLPPLFASHVSDGVYPGYTFFPLLLHSRALPPDDIPSPAARDGAVAATSPCGASAGACGGPDRCHPRHDLGSGRPPTRGRLPL